MKDEYDFSKAQRGRFFRRDAALVPHARGITLNDLVNELLKQDIARIDAAE